MIHDLDCASDESDVRVPLNKTLLSCPCELNLLAIGPMGKLNRVAPSSVISGITVVLTLSSIYCS